MKYKNIPVIVPTLTADDVGELATSLPVQETSLDELMETDDNILILEVKEDDACWLIRN